MANARKLAVLALKEVEADGSYSNLTFNRLVSDTESLTVQDKALAGNIFYGVLDRKISLDYVLASLIKTPLKKLNIFTLCVLRSAMYQIMYLDRIPDSAAVNEAVKLMKGSGKTAHQSGFVNAVLRNYLRSPISLPDGNGAFELGIRYSCPQWIVECFINDYGTDTAVSLLEEALESPPLYLRVNTVKTTPEKLIALLTNDGISVSGTQTADALCINGGMDIRESRQYKEGLFHVQDLSSQRCAALLSPRQGEHILDLCAAPGGKSFTVAELMNNNGSVTACDIYSHRVELISTGAKRLGLDIIETRTLDASAPLPFKNKFDAVLCDVPCSGLGIIRRKPDIKYKEDLDFALLRETQLKILLNAAKAVRTGGRIVYSTCTLRKAENREIIDSFLSEIKNAVLVKEHTFMPHIDKTDGFYAALISLN